MTYNTSLAKPSWLSVKLHHLGHSPIVLPLTQRSMRFVWSWLNNIDRYWIKDSWQIYSRLLKDIAWYCNHPCTDLPVVCLHCPRGLCLSKGQYRCLRVGEADNVAAPWKTMHDSNLWLQLRTALSAKPWLFDTFCCLFRHWFVFGYLAVKRFPYLRFCPWIAEVYWKMA